MTATPHPVPYFDGDSEPDRWYTFRWLGEPGASPSERRMTPPQESLARTPDDEALQLLLDQIRTRAALGLEDEVAVLLRYAHHRWGEAGSLIARSAHAEGKGEPKQARRLAKKAAQLPGASVPTLRQAARMASATKAWPKAVSAWERVVEAAPDPSSAYALAHAQFQIGQPDAALRSIEKGARHDSALGTAVRSMAAQDLKALDARLALLEFVRHNLEEIRWRAATFERDAAALRATSLIEPMPVFVYWAQGLHAAPAIVQRCIADLQATTPRVTLLDESTRTAFSRLPATFVDRTQEWHRAHFAVGLRLDLLARYGGVWVDATCLCRTDIRRTATELVSQAPMFAFTYGASRISNWFLIARPGSRLIGMLRAALFLWWETEGYLIDYFLCHHVFEVLTYVDDQCGAEWAQVARRDSRVPHRVQRAMFDDTDPAGDLELLNSSFIHKLKYQYTPESVPLNSLLARLLRGSHRPNGSEPV